MSRKLRSLCAVLVLSVAVCGQLPALSYAAAADFQVQESGDAESAKTDEREAGAASRSAEPNVEEMVSDENQTDDVTEVKTGWFQDGDKKRYLLEDGSFAKGWLKVDGNWYYFDDEGTLKTGWASVSGKWYYLDPQDGVMATGWIEVDSQRYYLDASGAMKTGWMLDKGSWYYLSGSGAMKTGWVYLGGSWYYLDPDSGVMQVGHFQDSTGTLYFADSSGRMYSANGWK